MRGLSNNVTDGFAGRLKIPGFWQLQIAGWLTLAVLTFPLKWVVLGSIHSSIIVSLYREGLGFLTTWWLREVYRRVYHDGMGLVTLSALILSASFVTATLQAALCLAFHDTFDFDEEKIFKNAVIFGIVYFRGVLCFTWSCIYFGLKIFLENQDRKHRLVQSLIKRQETELRLLRAVINSHFLTNSLNTILHALEQGRQGVASMVQALAGYVNFSLRHKDDDFVLLGEEADALADYLILEKGRHNEHLDISCRVDEAARAISVPGIILQPLVENAIKYGLETCSPPITIRVVVSLEGSDLLIEVANTGHWITPEPERTSGGIGLENIRERLARLYPQRHRMEIVSEQNWVSIRIHLPAKS